MQIVQHNYNINITQNELAKLLSDFIILLKEDEITFEDDDMEFDVPMAIEHLHKALKLDGNAFQLVIKVADLLEKKYDVACRHGDGDWDKP